MTTDKVSTIPKEVSNEVVEKWASYCFKKFLVQSFRTINPGAHFYDNWHIDLLIAYLKSTLHGQNKRLIINIPPRSLKSTIISVAWPCWLLGINPAKRIIVASYSQILSIKHSQDCRRIMQSEWYQKMFPDTIIQSGRNEKCKFVTTKNGFRFATSIGGTLTGEGADVLIVDDPHTPMQAQSEVERTRALDWFDQTFCTRLNDKRKGSIVVIMQRLHAKDLSGHLLKKGNWAHVCLPAIADCDTEYKVGSFRHLRKAGEVLNPKQDSKEDLENTAREVGSYGFNAQYLQKPLSTAAGLIKYGYLLHSDVEIPSLESFDSIYQSWDCASKATSSSDYSVCTTWGVRENKYYLLDVIRERVEYGDLKALAVRAAQCYKPSAILIEDKSSGQALIQELGRQTQFPVIAINPHRDKAVRVMNVSNMFESGKVILPYSAHWLHAYEEELVNFPATEHDDMVDSTTQFLEWVRNRVVFAPTVRCL